MSSLIIAPPRGQWSPNSLSVPMMMLWVYVSSLVMICQRAAEILACFRFGGFAVEYHWLSQIFLEEIIY